MAQTTEEIYNAIVAEKQALSSLDGLTTPTGQNQARILLNQLNSNSRVAIWRLWAWIVAFILSIQQRLWDLAKQELVDLAEQAKVGTDAWLIARMKDAQLGDTAIVTDDFKVVYATIDETKRYITKVVIGREDGNVVVKLAAGEPGSLRQLNLVELGYAQGWLNNIQSVAPRAFAISRQPDAIRLAVKIYYNPIFNATSVRSNVEDAIRAFLATNEDKAGFISIQLLTDAIQKATGVADVEIDTIEGKSATATSFSNFRTQRGYLTFAGYANYDSSGSLITMVAI